MITCTQHKVHNCIRILSKAKRSKLAVTICIWSAQSPSNPIQSILSFPRLHCITEAKPAVQPRKISCLEKISLLVALSSFPAPETSNYGVSAPFSQHLISRPVEDHLMRLVRLQSNTLNSVLGYFSLLVVNI
ncbi:hypothetical protein NC652_016664 [Populus alba x Populus x berolinensis]|nr:hypothetical protein NC652_016664 [Populus alba x Populus x berolinensis]